MSAVASSDPSSTNTTSNGSKVCANALWSVSARNFSPLWDATMSVTTGSAISPDRQVGHECAHCGRNRLQIRAELERIARQTGDEAGHLRQLALAARVELDDRARAECRERLGARYLDESRRAEAWVESRNENRIEAKARRRGAGKVLVHVDDGLLPLEEVAAGEERRQAWQPLCDAVRLDLRSGVEAGDLPSRPECRSDVVVARVEELRSHTGEGDRRFPGTRLPGGQHATLRRADSRSVVLAIPARREPPEEDLPDRARLLGGRLPERVLDPVPGRARLRVEHAECPEMRSICTAQRRLVEVVKLSDGIR